MTESTIPANDVQLLLQMVKLLVEEKAIAAEEKKEKLRVQQARDESHRKIAQYNEAEERKKQTYCTHLKNQPMRNYFTPKSPKIDYAVSHHHFPDGKTYVRCLICGAKWHKGDTDEFIFIGGKKLQNWTGIGWDKALKMVVESTNTSTSSEIPFTNVMNPTTSQEQ